MTESKAKASFLMSRSIFGRFMFYIFLYILIWLVMIFILSIVPNDSIFRQDTTVSKILFTVVLFGTPIIIPYFVEKSIRSWRKENGISIYKSIKLKDLEQMEVNRKVAMEKKAYEKAGVNQNSMGEKDIGYWFDLKEKGAITEEEFLAKKKELL